MVKIWLNRSGPMMAASPMASWVRISRASTPPMAKNTIDVIMKRLPIGWLFTSMNQPRRPGALLQVLSNSPVRDESIR